MGNSSYKLGGLQISVSTPGEILDLDHAFVITANAATFYLARHDSTFRRASERAVVTLDGRLPYWIARLKRSARRPVLISGSDLIYEIAEFVREKSGKMFLLGGYHDSNHESVRRLEAEYGIRVSGYIPERHEYPFPDSIDREIMKRISEFNPTHVVVAFGTPKQELWIYDHFDRLSDMGVRMVVGVGGTFEFVSWRIRRAPRAVRYAGLEGIYRFVREPKWFRLRRLITSAIALVSLLLTG